MKLSEHLSVKEVSKSNTAARRGIDNTPEGMVQVFVNGKL